ncbi:hypothetical protein [Campylobacter sp. RM16190]|uniref:hypothetical protein n=1 Tax=Campylobacter sp. RM16190 TaxID=1705727 RepID=UPI0014730C18|nr:hypothetical protein [Campylobacter sp. RM16190]
MVKSLHSAGVNIERVHFIFYTADFWKFNKVKREQSQVINKSSDKKIPKQEAMSLLGIGSSETMSRLAKKHNLSTIKKWKNVFYYESEILTLKDKREKERVSKKPNANFKEKKEKIRNEKIAETKTKTALIPLKEANMDVNLKAKKHAVIKELKEIGLYEYCDLSVVYAYCVNDIKLDRVIEQMGDNFTTYDHNGNEIPHPLIKVYYTLTGVKRDLARALGLGAGNRKGLKISEMIELDEMDKLLDG